MASTTTEQTTENTTQQRELTHDLLRYFEETAEGVRYSADSEKIKLLSLYVLVRQLTPDLTFELFLEKFQPMADFTEDNRKYPDDSIRFHLPRAKKAAEERKVEQWSAKEVVDMLVLYVDMCREADAAGMAVPLTLDEYLEMDGPGYKDGTVVKPQKTPKNSGRKQRGGQRAPTIPQMTDAATGVNMSDNPLRPTQAGQRIVYRHPNQNGRQILGVTRVITAPAEDQRSYVTFQTDEGELFENVSIVNCELVNEQQSPQQQQQPDTPDVDTNSVCAEKLWIPKADYDKIRPMLGINKPVGNFDIGTAIEQWSTPLEGGRYALDIQLMNGKDGTYVDAQFVENQQDQVLLDLQPRENLLGTYECAYGTTRYKIEVKVRGE